MKALLKILYFFLALIVIFLLVGIFLPKSTQISTNILIKSTPELVFVQVNTLKNWVNWVPGIDSDTLNLVSYNNIQSGVGASYQLKNKNSDTPSLNVTIVESRPNNQINADFDFGKQGKAMSIWTFKEETEGTRVEWNFENHHLKYFERYFLIFFKKNMLRTFNSGLEKLKETCEDLNLDRISDVSEVLVPHSHAIVINDSSEIAEAGEKMSILFDKLKSYIEKRKIEPVDKPFTIYFKRDNESINTFACGIPIAEKTWSWQEYQYFEIDSCKAIMVTHWGKYGSVKPYKAMNEYLIENDLSSIGFPWEVYINSPQTEKDTSKWQTLIYLPVR